MSMRRIKWLLFAVLGVLLSGCYYPQQTEEYGVGYNFIVTADSLQLQTAMPLHTDPMAVDPDTISVYRGAPLVVAQLLVIPEDSIDSVWVKVAMDQETQGWLHESNLLPGVVPDDPISQFIHTFSASHIWVFLTLFFFTLSVMLVRRMLRRPFPVVHLNDIASPYPVLLCITLSAASVLYASMQNFVPKTWEYFYFHPTLNPFGLPLILGFFLSSLWLLVLLFGAALLDILRCLRPTEAVLYTLSLLSLLSLLYVFFSLLTLYYIGYPLFLVYAVWSLRRYLCHHRARFVCGSCGASMHSLGICPRCGAKNV